MEGILQSHSRRGGPMKPKQNTIIFKIAVVSIALVIGSFTLRQTSLILTKRAYAFFGKYGVDIARNHGENVTHTLGIWYDNWTIVEFSYLVAGIPYGVIIGFVVSYLIYMASKLKEILGSNQ